MKMTRGIAAALAAAATLAPLAARAEMPRAAFEARDQWAKCLVAGRPAAECAAYRQAVRDAILGAGLPEQFATAVADGMAQTFAELGARDRSAAR
jgi:hypothetical protein